MNADDKAHWLRPSPPIAVDGDPSRVDYGDASSSLMPVQPPGNPVFRLKRLKSSRALAASTPSTPTPTMPPA